MTKENIELIKSELEKVIGPIGRFIVDKQLQVMKQNEDSFPPELLGELIDRVVDIGVYDRQMSKSIKIKLRQKVGLE